MKLDIILKFSKITIVSFLARGKTVTIWVNNTLWLHFPELSSSLSKQQTCLLKYYKLVVSFLQCKMVLITEGNVMQLFLKFSPKSGTFVSREGFTCGLFHNRPNVYILFTFYGFESYIMTLSYFACHELDTRRLSTLYHWPFQISNIFVCFKGRTPYIIPRLWSLLPFAPIYTYVHFS